MTPTELLERKDEENIIVRNINKYLPSISCNIPGYLNRNVEDKLQTFQRLLEGCLTVHLPHEIKCNANLIQLGNFIDVFLARHVSGTYAHHQEH